MTEQDFAALLARGYEVHGVEFKGPGKRSDKGVMAKVFMARVIRAVLGMANRGDGGLVIIGVEDDDGSLVPTGLDEDQLDTWQRYDELSKAINEYARPSVSFDREFQDYQGAKFVIITVHEFNDIPTLCGKDYHDPREKKVAPILRQGACYVRSRHSPGTSEIPSEEEMRELLVLAIEKGVRQFVEVATRAGFKLPNQATAGDKDEGRFVQQREDSE